MPVLDTARLILVPLPLDVAEALVHGRRPVSANWAPDYPTDSTLVAASMVVTAAVEGQALGPWTAYQIVRRDNGCAIGGCGFIFGPPDHDGHVQISFSIVDSERGRRFEAEAVAALIAWARRQSGVTRVLAETAASNVDGVRVYETAGMRRSGSDGEIIFFEA